jgi:hypothetical protein
MHRLDRYASVLSGQLKLEGIRSDRQHRTSRGPHDSFGHTAQEHVRQTRATMCAHHDEVCTAPFRLLCYYSHRMPFARVFVPGDRVKGGEVGQKSVPLGCQFCWREERHRGIVPTSGAYPTAYAVGMSIT